EQSLAVPLNVALPYTESGYFAPEEPKAAAIIFKGRRGEKLTISLTKKPAARFAIFFDLWHSKQQNQATPELITAGDSALTPVVYEIEEEGNFIVRLQPELLQGGEYTLTITSGPALAFPVTPKVKSNIASFWGVDRDGGSRRHEGIDIFAPRRTALVAAANGTVTRVNANTLGGKVVFMKPDSKNYTLYYAHLEAQLVEAGQQVKVGDSIGLMGNTGNARHTSPHLHFGIYTHNGAIDPLPFVQQVRKTPEKISAPLTRLGQWVRNSKKSNLAIEPLPNTTGTVTVEANTLLKVEAATADKYKVILPGGETSFISSANVTPISLPIIKARTKASLPLLDGPTSTAATKTRLVKGQLYSVLAVHKNFYFILANNTEGWIERERL
ncbi:MAG TPA: M23 family metallopeptidase, partial [Segetibacter sp.]